MNRYKDFFPRRHAVLPVIHVTSSDQALRNSQIARDAGADGVFLINHGMAAPSLLDIHATVADVHPDWWIGVNCLDLSPTEVFAAVSEKVSGVWVDNAGIDECSASQFYADGVWAAEVRTHYIACISVASHLNINDTLKI